MSVEPANLKAPGIPPAELWMFWVAETGVWVLSFDDAPRGQTYLVSLSEREALVAARYQWDVYEVDCVAVRVK